MAFPLLQTPKTKEFFGGLKADHGHKLVFADAASLENRIMAYYSRDVNMLKLYQRGRPANCGYIAFGMSIPEYAVNFSALGYNIDTPTPESIKAVKKEHGDIRDKILKPTVLGCIAEGTLVRVKDHGYLPIENIVKGMLVWDGNAWVCTDGAVYKGVKPCINFNGHWMTYDHRVYTKDGWKQAASAQESCCIRPNQASYSWADVWQLARYFIFSKERKQLPNGIC